MDFFASRLRDRIGGDHHLDRGIARLVRVLARTGPSKNTLLELSGKPFAEHRVLLRGLFIGVATALGLMFTSSGFWWLLPTFLLWSMSISPMRKPRSWASTTRSSRSSSCSSNSMPTAAAPGSGSR